VKVRLLSNVRILAGENNVAGPGFATEELELDDDQARDLIASGSAEAIVPPTVPVKAKVTKSDG